MGDTKKLYLVLDMNTSYHQSKAGQPFGSSTSFVKTEEALQQYLSNVKRQGASPIVYDMDTPQARVVASRENSVCKEWLGRNGAMLERYDHGYCVLCGGAGGVKGAAGSLFGRTLCAACGGTGRGG